MQVARARLQRNFSDAAADYDTHAQFQHSETRRMLDAALMLLPEYARIADIGCGTGYFAHLARARRPDWHIVGLDLAAGMARMAARRCRALQADAARLPFADGVLDACVSSLCLQWVPDKQAALREITRVLRPGGRAILATLGADSLTELRAAAAQAALPLGLLPMADAAAYRAAIAGAGLEVTLFEQRRMVEYYPQVRGLLDSMRLIGAGNNFAGAGRGMTGARRFRAMLAAYERQRTPEGIPASWEQLFLLLRKPE